MERNMHRKAIVGLMGVLVLTGAVLGSGIAFADDSADSGSTTDDTTNTVSSSASANASVTVSAACSFSRTSGSGEYTGILANNASVEITGSTFNTICNDSGGYAIYAVGYGNNTLGEADLISANGSSNIATSSSPASGASYWQMKLTAATDNQPVLENGYGNYSAIPSTYTKVASYSTITDSASSGTRTGQAITAHYKAYASSTQPADTYAGAVKYTMVHPGTITAPSICPANSICYSPNADGTVNGSMGNQTIARDATSATLLASNFWRSGYGFAGWNTEYDGSGTFYGPNEDIEFEAGQYGGTNGGLSLYAVWVKSTGYLQDWNGCQTLTRTTYNSETGKLVASLSSITALTDKRDNQTYAVARLADGNCWMIENLRLSNYYLDSNGTVQDVSFAASNTQGLGTGANNVFVGLANPEVANFANNTTANSLYSTNGNNNTHNITYSSNDPGNLGYRMPRYRNDNTNSVTSKNNNVTVANMANTNQNVYSYGNYYSWAAAIANTMHYTSYSASDTAGTSICPSGWRLPMGGRKASVNNSDFWKLSRANIGADPANFANDYFYYTGNPEGVDASRALRSFPNNFLYSGGVYNSNIFGRGSNGYYWSSSAGRADYAYNLRLGSSDLNPGTYGSDKFYGFTVRCVVAPSS